MQSSSDLGFFEREGRHKPLHQRTLSHNPKLLQMPISKLLMCFVLGVAFVKTEESDRGDRWLVGLLIGWLVHCNKNTKVGP